MTTSYRIRSLAQDDLEFIWLYTCEVWSVTQADSYLDAIIQRFDWLAENPTLGKARDDVKLGYFCFPEGMHLIFYVLNGQGLKNDQIEIIGVPHQRMDIVEHLA
jgi:toxin ParE1/3/4